MSSSLLSFSPSTLCTWLEMQNAMLMMWCAPSHIFFSSPWCVAKVFRACFSLWFFFLLFFLVHACVGSILLYTIVWVDFGFSFSYFCCCCCCCYLHAYPPKVSFSIFLRCWVYECTYSFTIVAKHFTMLHIHHCRFEYFIALAVIYVYCSIILCMCVCVYPL